MTALGYSVIFFRDGWHQSSDELVRVGGRKMPASMLRFAPE
jgi:hypothetical protein